jgi:hypothetical protein
MDSKLRVTTEQDESAFIDLVDGRNVLNIPLFQRAYRWAKKNLDQFDDDIQGILDGVSESQFMGVLVFSPQDQKSTRPALSDVVDGQQRLTTCYLYVMAIAEIAAINGNVDWALEIAKTHLLTRRFTAFPTNTKLIPSAVDRQQFYSLWMKFKGLKAFDGHDWGEYEPVPPSVSGPEDGRMKSAYEQMLRKAKSLYKNGGKDLLEDHLEAILGNLSFVQINLRDPIVAPQIFERLNARGERISTADLVRNEIFSRVAEDATLAKSIFESHWEPFSQKFEERKLDLEKFLFPYGLMENDSLTKAELFHGLRAQWDGLTPQQIIQDLDDHTDVFFALECGDVSLIDDRDSRAALKRLHRLNAPSSTHTFFFSLFKELQNGEQALLTKNEALKIIDTLESFLFRRAVCGIEPTGLHAVFKGLWGELIERGYTAEGVRRSISRRTTVPWPRNDSFVDEILNSNLYRRTVAKYALTELECATEGETPDDDFEIEHVYPQNPANNWDVIVSPSESDLINSWGNLIPLSKAQNGSLGNSAYSSKVRAYAQSVFATARSVAQNHPSSWCVNDMTARGQKIASWALTRWPHERLLDA